MPATLQQHLPPGAKLSDYELREVLGDGGFAITYRAWDSHLHQDVAIKEFLPKDLALREPGGAAVLARSGHESEYRLAWRAGPWRSRPWGCWRLAVCCSGRGWSRAGSQCLTRLVGKNLPFLW